MKGLWRNLLLAAVIAGLCLSPAFAGGKAEQKPAEIRYVAANHPFTDALKPLLAGFTEKTGIKVNLENYEENQLTQKLTVEFTSGVSTIDVFMTRPLQEGKLFARNKYYEFLGPYLSNTSKTPAAWDWKDYPAGTIGAVTFEGQVYAVPIVTEWETLFYRKDLFQQAGVKVPTNFQELEAAAMALHKPEAEQYGIVSRGQRGAAVTQFSSYLYNYGGDFIKNGRAAFNSPEALEAFAYYGRLLGKYGPPGVTNMSWPQAQALMAAGKVAMWTDASVLITGLIDPAKSQIADKLGVAVFPAGPKGNKPYMVVPWALGVGAQSKNKDAAWQFLTWAAGKDVAKTSQLAGLTMARSSVWSDPAVVPKLFPGLADTAAKIGPTATPYDRPLMTAVSEARDAIGLVIVEAINTAGAGDLRTLANAAVSDVDKLLDRAGELGK